MAGMSDRHKPVTGEALLQQRRKLAELGAALPYRLDPEKDLPMGAGAALSRLLGLRPEEVPRFWRGERAFNQKV